VLKAQSGIPARAPRQTMLGPQRAPSGLAASTRTAQPSWPINRTAPPPHHFHDPRMAGTAPETMRKCPNPRSAPAFTSWLKQYTEQEPAPKHRQPEPQAASPLRVAERQTARDRSADRLCGDTLPALTAAAGAPRGDGRSRDRQREHPSPHLEHRLEPFSRYRRRVSAAGLPKGALLSRAPAWLRRAPIRARSAAAASAGPGCGRCRARRRSRQAS
jgi:hypothetical protein